MPPLQLLHRSVPEPETVFSAGEPTAFEALMRAHYARLCDFAVHLVHSRDLAEDLVQDVFVQLWKAHEEIELRDPLRYLYQAVRNRVVNHRRRQGVREGWERYVLAHSGEGGDATAVESVQAADLADAYRSVLQELPERCRLVFLLSRDQGLTYPEIARALEISVKTVETQMGRALKLLRHRLHPYLVLALALGAGNRLLA